jgi:hypothetical protein
MSSRDTRERPRQREPRNKTQQVCFYSILFQPPKVDGLMSKMQEFERELDNGTEQKPVPWNEDSDLRESLEVFNRAQPRTTTPSRRAERSETERRQIVRSEGRAVRTEASSEVRARRIGPRSRSKTREGADQTQIVSDLKNAEKDMPSDISNMLDKKVGNRLSGEMSLALITEDKARTVLSDRVNGRESEAVSNRRREPLRPRREPKSPASQNTLVTSPSREPKEIDIPESANPRTSDFMSRAVMIKIGTLFADDGDSQSNYTSDSNVPDLTDMLTLNSIIQQASLDTEGFTILLPEKYLEAKKRLVQITNYFESLQNKLSLEFKVKEATEAILKFNSDESNQVEEAKKQMTRTEMKMNEMSKGEP